MRIVHIDSGIKATWRYTKGKDIAAACGQLALKKVSNNIDNKVYKRETPFQAV